MQRILVRIPQWLGDAVVSTVFVTRLKNRFPTADILVLSPIGLADIFTSHPAVSSVISFSPRQSVFSVAKHIREKSCETVYILPRSFRTALEAFWARIPNRIGFHGDFRAPLLTTAIPYRSEFLYPHRYLRLIGEEGIHLSTLKPYFPCSAPGHAHPNLMDAFSRGTKPILGLAPVSIAPSRTWEEEKFLELARLFYQTYGGTVILFGSKSEKNVTSRMARALGDFAIDTAGELSLPELGWALKQCSALVANDSGLMHAASCFEIPTVVLFGASDPQWALPPWGKTHALQHKEVACVPCLKNNCVRFGDGRNECLKKITVSEAMAALDSLLP